MDKPPLALLLNKLIAAAPKEHEGAVALQVQIASQSHAGSVRHSTEHEGLYEIVVVDPKQRVAFSVFFDETSITALFVPQEQKSVKTGSGIIMPGAH
jgi:hypothetical protein